jgi:hypothetical protein
VSAQKAGEAFRFIDGLPVSRGREAVKQSWFEFAQSYVDLKWTRAAAKSRAGNADTMAMFATTRGKPSDTLLRKAMTGWAFNTKRRNTERPPEIDRALRWLASNTLSVSRLDDPAVVRRVLEQLAVKMDSQPPPRQSPESEQFYSMHWNTRQS